MIQITHAANKNIEKKFKKKMAYNSIIYLNVVGLKKIYFITLLIVLLMYSIPRFIHELNSPLLRFHYKKIR